MIYSRLVFLGALLFYFSNDILGQDTTSLNDIVRDTFYLMNPSFEDVPRRGGEISKPIFGWQDCGHIFFPYETAPDIHPVPGGAWGVEGKAMDSDTYLGLVIRDNASRESVSQNLNATLSPEKCYSLNAYLSLSPVYESMTKLSNGKLEDFSHPAVLRIWGGSGVCDGAELLAVGFPVAHYNWKEYEFILRPTIPCQSITLEAFYYFPESDFAKEKPTAYNGHIMIDHLSPIIEVECK